jgi:hypothetical protein
MASITKERSARTSKIKAVTSRLVDTIGSRIDKMEALRASKRELEAQIKLLDADYAGLEEALISEMDKQGVEKASGKKATVSFTSTTVANVDNWDEFLEFVYENKFGHLLQRRVSDPAYRELLDLGKVVPGATPFIKRRTNLRSI